MAKKNLAAVAVGVAGVGAAIYMGIVGDFSPDSQLPAVEVAIKDTVIAEHYEPVAAVFDSVGNTLVAADSVLVLQKTLYAGKENQQLRVNDLDGEGDGVLAIGDTLGVLTWLYKAAEDTTYAIFWRYAPDAVTYPGTDKILMYRIAGDVIVSNKVGK